MSRLYQCQRHSQWRQCQLTVEFMFGSQMSRIPVFARQLRLTESKQDIFLFFCEQNPTEKISTVDGCRPRDYDDPPPLCGSRKRMKRVLSCYHHHDALSLNARDSRIISSQAPKASKQASKQVSGRTSWCGRNQEAALTANPHRRTSFVVCDVRARFFPRLGDPASVSIVMNVCMH